MQLADSAIPVELVERHSTFHEVVSTAGPFVVAAAAIIAALIAWRSAGTRLEKELRHDRETRRDEYRRDALGSALELIRELDDAARGFQRTLYHSEAAWTAAGRILEDPDAGNLVRQDAKRMKATSESNVKAEYDRAFRRTGELAAAISRLKVRFGTNHEIPRSAQELEDKWERIRVSAAAGLLYQVTRDQSEAEKAADETKSAETAFEKFMAASESWLK
jgi:hypothetical protein